MDDDALLVVLVEAHVGEELASAVVAKGCEGKRLGGLGPEQDSTWSASTVTVQEATQGVPVTIRSQQSSTGSIREMRRPFSS